jgi:hypothetical protein
MARTKRVNMVEPYAIQPRDGVDGDVLNSA